MKRNIYFILALFVLTVCLSTCKRIELEPQNTYIGTWNIAAIYMNGGNVNNKGLAEMIQPCLKGATLEFREDLVFDLQCECDYLRAAGNYTFDNVSITATDTLSDSHHTQVFTFVNGFLFKMVEAQSYKFELKFEKIK